MADTAPPTRRTQIQRRAEAQNRLLRAAAELIAERGLEAITLAAVGERAGYSRGIANHHFGTKAALIDELISQVERDFRASTEPVARVDGSIDALIEMASTFIRLTDELPVTHRAFLVLWAAAVADEELRARMGGLDEAFRDVVTLIIGRGQVRGEIDAAVDAASAAVALLGQLRGIALQRLLSPQDVDMQRARVTVEMSIRRFLAAP